MKQGVTLLSAQLIVLLHTGEDDSLKTGSVGFLAGALYATYEAGRRRFTTSGGVTSGTRARGGCGLVWWRELGHQPGQHDQIRRFNHESCSTASQKCLHIKVKARWMVHRRLPLCLTLYFSNISIVCSTLMNIYRTGIPNLPLFRAYLCF